MSREFVFAVEHFITSCVILEWACQARTIGGMNETMSLQLLPSGECFSAMFANEILLFTVNSYTNKKFQLITLSFRYWKLGCRLVQKRGNWGCTINTYKPQVLRPLFSAKQLGALRKRGGERC